MERDPPLSSARKLAQVATAIASGSCAGVIAAMPQSAGVFLVGLQSLAAGALLSVLLVGSSALFGIARPRWPAALLAAIVAILTQHVWLYRLAMAGRRDAAAREPAVEMFRPGWSEQGFIEYMKSEATTGAMLMWALDACLLTIAAIVIVELSGKLRTAPGQEPTA